MRVPCGHSKLRWQDATFFAYRRSERFARLTKQYLENKWGVEFPNTGFSNFVKFSVVRSAFWTQQSGSLPHGWEQMVSLYYAWFEVAGFNIFGQSRKLLPEFLESFPNNLTLPTHASRVFDPYKAEKEAPASGVDVKKILQIREKTDFFETDLPQALLSTGVAKYSIKGDCATPGVMQSLQPFCGLMVEETVSDGQRCTCWLYVAPYGYDSGVYKGLEAALRFFNLPERIAVYAALRLEHEDLLQARTEFMEMLSSSDAETYFTVCGSGDDNSECKVDMDGFSKNANLLQWSFRLNSWTAMHKALQPPAFSFGSLSLWGLFSAGMAILVLLIRQSSKKL